MVRGQLGVTLSVAFHLLSGGKTHISLPPCHFPGHKAPAPPKGETGAKGEGLSLHLLDNVLIIGEDFKAVSLYLFKAESLNG